MSLSTRKVALESLKGQFEKARNGRYFVRRGPINWASHKFTEANAFACAILVSESTLFRNEGTNESFIRIFLVTRVEEAGGELDDAVLAAMTDDAVEALQQMGRQVDTLGDSATLAIDWDGATVVEFLDAETQKEASLQGVEIQIAITY